MLPPLVRALLAAACAALIAPAAAGAADLQFGSVQQLSPDGLVADSPAVEVDPNGNAVAGWRESVGGKWEAHAAYRTAGGFFSTPSVRLSPAGVDAGAPLVAIARDGTAIAVWSQPQTSPAGRTDVAAAVRPPGGAFGSPVVLSPGTDSAFPGAVEFDRAGNAIVMITTDLGNGGVGKQRAELISRPAGGGFSAPSPVYTTVGDAALNQDGQLGLYDIAFDAAGNAVVGFAENSYAFNQDRDWSELRGFGRSAGGTIELPPKRIGGRNTDRAVSGLHMGISGSRQVAVYTRQVGAGTSDLEYVTRAASGDEWSGYRVLAGDRSDPRLAPTSGGLTADAAGNALVAVNGAQVAPGPSVPREFFLPTGATLFSGAHPSPAGIDGADAQLKDAGDGQRYWTTQVGAASHLWFASRGAGETPSFGAPRDIGSFNVGGPAVAVGPNGHTAVLWLVQQGLDTKVQAIFGDEPTPGVEPPPPAPAPPPPPPVTNAIDAVGKVESGRPVVLSVAVTGVVSSIEWRIGNSRPYYGDAVNRAIRLRVNGTQTVKATLIGPGGTKTVSRTITGPRAPTDADARRVASGEPSSASAVIATGRPGVLSGKDAGCAGTNLYAGGRTLVGCMRPIDELTDIPAGERGVLDPLASAYRLTRSDAPLMDRAVQLLDGYVTTGTLTLDGLWPVVPSGGARIVSFPQAEALTSSNAAFRLAGQALKPAGGGFNLRLTSSASPIDLGSVPRPAGLKDLGGLAYAGDFDVTLGGGFATIETNLRFPGFVSRNGIAVQPRVRIYASPDRILTENLATLGPYDRVDFGPVPMIGLKLSYDAGAGEWAGGADACLYGPGCLEFQPPLGGLRFGGDGELVYAKTAVDYGDPGRPLAPGIFLENAGVGFGLNPTRIFGSARLNLGTFVKVDGREVFAFPSSAAPYVLRRDEVGDSFPAALYAKKFTNPLIAAGADVLIKLPVIGEQRLGGGYLLFESGGYAAMGGSASIDVLGIIRFSGSIDGEYNFGGQRYNLHGDIRACLIAVDDDLCAGAVTHMSRGAGLEGGAGGCLQVGPVSVGGGVLWAEPGKPKVWPLDGCKWSPFRIAIAGRAAQAASSFTMRVTADGPSPVLRLDGAGAAPRVKVTGPGGRTLTSGDGGLAYSPDGKIRIVHVNTAQAHTTYVGLQNAAPGTWRVEPLPGSAAVTSSARATDPPAARVTGTVSGDESERVLSFDVGTRPAQRVTFYDVSPSGARKAIGTATSGKGRIRFTPAPGGGAHRILAAFELDGIPAEEKTVARFTPPSATLPTPAGLQVRRSGSRLAVTWAAVRGATSYELAVTTTGGRQVFKTAKTRRATIAAIAKTASGTVTVRAAATLRHSRVARRTFQATKATKRRLTSLRRCSVKGKRVSCRR